MARRKHSPANMILGIIGGLFYVGLILLFAWQTWQFVSWLFPDDQLLMKVLTVVTFDVCALFWGTMHLFYHFANRAAKTWVLCGWILTNILSALASVFYLVIQSMFRFNLQITPTTVNIGYAIAIFALIFDGTVFTMWVYLEYLTRHPHQDDFAYYDDEEENEELPPPYRGKQKSTMPQLEAPQQQVQLAQTDGGPGLLQSIKNVFASKDTEDATQGSKSAMEQWMDLYKKSGDDAALSFPDWLRMVQESAPDDPPKK